MVKNKKRSKKIIITLAVFFIVMAGFLIYRYVVVDKQQLVDKDTKSTSDIESAQSEFSSAGDREPAGAQTKPETSVNDTGGSAQPQSTSAPLVSKDGAITVFSPANNAVFTSGSSLVGKSTDAKVSYRLIDDVSGVTTTGELGVINGNFSGKFSFSTRAAQGRIDVFQTGPGGVEKSIIEIPVRFR
jgi:type II secretory pathway pseudopilin PulG